MIRKFILSVFFSLTFILGICQDLKEKHKKKAALEGETEKHLSSYDDSTFFLSILNDAYGLNLYENLNYRLGGDSIRHDKKGYATRGWVEDYYPSGSLLHRGYYSDGYLKVYKNYFPNGITERSYKTIDHNRSAMELYYYSGTLKSIVIYNGGIPIKWEDYYPSGKLEYFEEFNKSLDYYIIRESFFPGGTVKESLKLIKESQRLYEIKKFNIGGVLIEDGRMFYSEIVYAYQKTGKWTIYNETGNPIKEEIYDKGRLKKSKSL